MTVVEGAAGRVARTDWHLPARLVAVGAAVGDVVWLAVATVVAMLGRQRIEFFDPRNDISTYVLVAAVPIVVGWLAVLRGVGAYARDVFGAGIEEYKRVIRGSLLAAGLVGIVCYLTTFPLSRGFFMLLFATGTPLLVFGRLAFRRSVQR